MAKLRVAIIGAGGAGLAMCKCLTNEPQIDFVVFEKCDKIGGVWLYTKNEIKRSGHTAMYKNLRTNLPKVVMAFPEYPFSEELPSFNTWKTVWQYLEDFAHHFNLMKYIKLQHKVISVKPCINQEAPMWQVVIKDLKNGNLKDETFNAVVVCNGNFSVPILPEIPGIKDFPGTIIHSLDYDEPTVFKDQTVVVVGAASSGMDICVAIAKFAKKVYSVHRGNKISSKIPENIEEIVGTLTCAFPDGTFEVNHKIKTCVIQTVVFCTGYAYSYPFLTPECNIKVQENRVTSLYKHVFSTTSPGLSFIGLLRQICPFPQFTLQAKWIASVLTGRKVLPSREEMIKDEELDCRERLDAGMPLRKMHFMPDKSLAKYDNEVAVMAGVEPLSPALHALYRHVAKLRKEQLSTYRNTNYYLKENEWFETEGTKE